MKGEFLDRINKINRIGRQEKFLTELLRRAVISLVPK
jgi:hypothetical protein